MKHLWGQSFQSRIAGGKYECGCVSVPKWGTWNLDIFIPPCLWLKALYDNSFFVVVVVFKATAYQTRHHTHKTCHRLESGPPNQDGVAR